MLILSWLKNRGTFFQLFIIYLVITAICTAFSALIVSDHGLKSFALGQFYMWLSFLSISFSTHLFFLKKEIALLIAVIVFKWPILIYVVYLTTEAVKPNSLLLALGFIPLIISSLIWASMQKE